MQKDSCVAGAGFDAAGRVGGAVMSAEQCWAGLQSCTERCVVCGVIVRQMAEVAVRPCRTWG